MDDTAKTYTEYRIKYTFLRFIYMTTDRTEFGLRCAKVVRWGFWQ